MSVPLQPKTILILTKMKQMLMIMAAMLLSCCSSDSEAMAEVVSPGANTEGEIGKTLVVYYSYTGNCREIVTTLRSKPMLWRFNLQRRDCVTKPTAMRSAQSY